MAEPITMNVLEALMQPMNKHQGLKMVTKDDLVSKDTALKMAIEALDTLMMEKGSIYQQALEACKGALEQPAQEPKINGNCYGGIMLLKEKNT